jgi:hypothetical protein
MQSQIVPSHFLLQKINTRFYVTSLNLELNISSARINNRNYFEILQLEQKLVRKY